MIEFGEMDGRFRFGTLKNLKRDLGFPYVPPRAATWRRPRSLCTLMSRVGSLEIWPKKPRVPPWIVVEKKKAGVLAFLAIPTFFQIFPPTSRAHSQLDTTPKRVIQDPM